MDKLIAALRAEVEMLRIRVHLKDERIAELESQIRMNVDYSKQVAALERRVEELEEKCDD